VLRTLAACALPTFAVAVSWLRLEEPPRVGEAWLVVALALAPALLPRGWHRALAAVAAVAAASWVVYGVHPWELLPFRDQRVLEPVAQQVDHGLGDFYGVLLPLSPERNPEMHALVLTATFCFVLGLGLLVAVARPVAAAAVTVAGAGWPATLIDGDTVVLGALALAAALSIPLVLRVRSGPSLLAGIATATLVVAGAAWASSATTVVRQAALNWESWDLGRIAPEATAVQFVWDSNYAGITFPQTRTVVLRVEGPDRPLYWRASTLDLFARDPWYQDLVWRGRVRSRTPMPLDRFTPRRAAEPTRWLEQRVEVEAFVDYHLAAAGTPIALDTRRVGTVFQLSGGVLRAQELLGAGQQYRVWSYVPDPTPAALAASEPRYPTLAWRYLRLAGRNFPGFGRAGRDARVRELLADRSFADLLEYTALYETARRVAGDADTPYAAVLALESWFRYRGGFEYDERPPPGSGAPLVSFVTRTRAGYCQHFAGAMTVMLRLLGIPSRVAVGFTSGSQKDGSWVVTDHEAHAWVEVWFADEGWIPFDPTPGRGTFGGDYSFASDSESAREALDRGDLSFSGRERGPDPPDIRSEVLAASERDGDPSLVTVAVGLGTVWMLLVGLGKAALRRARYLTRDPRRAATASRRELEAFLRDQGIAVPASATLDDLRRALGEELGLDGKRFADEAARARFGKPAEAQRGADAARRELRLLLRRARSELSAWARFRGFVSLRSLRSGWQGSS
jgi:transglutaminase-like putative cysteine protease